MKDKGGRPTVMTESVIAKLEEAFLIGCSDLEACLVADISKDALYDYQNKYPKFTERKELLKQNPILAARRSAFKGFADDHAHALKFLERKKKSEFSLRSESTVEVTMPTPIMDLTNTDAV